jgi:VWFA-related protein
VYLASNELLKKQAGRKALVVLTDGVDRGSKESLESAIEAAQRADTAVYAIRFRDQRQENYGGFDHGGRGRGWPSGGSGGHRGGGPKRTQEPRPDGKLVLDRISRETVGRLFEVSKKEPIDKIYGSIAEELRTQYSLGYTPDQSNASSGYRKIRLTAKQKDLRVQTREGYYAEQEDSSQRTSSESPVAK